MKNVIVASSPAMSATERPCLEQRRIMHMKSHRPHAALTVTAFMVRRINTGIALNYIWRIVTSRYYLTIN